MGLSEGYCVGNDTVVSKTLHMTDLHEMVYEICGRMHLVFTYLYILYYLNRLYQWRIRGGGGGGGGGGGLLGSDESPSAV